MNDRILRDCSITPDEVLAGDTVEFTIAFTVGPEFSAEGSRIVFDMPGYLATDRPNRYDQESGGYVEVFCDNADIEYRCLPWDMEILDFPTKTKRSYRGTAQRLLILDFLRGTAREGDEIRVKWGWARSGFAAGCKVTPLVLKPEFRNTVYIRYFRDGAQGLPDLGRSFKGYERPTPDAEVPVRFRVKPRETEALRFVRGLSESALLIYDRFFNVRDDEDFTRFLAPGADARRNAFGVPVTHDSKLEVNPGAFPLKQTPDMSNAFDSMNIYFGDIHTHSKYSNDCIERERQEMTPRELFEYGRDVARLDFMAVTDHHQPWDKERNKQPVEYWNASLADVKAVDEPGRFLAFPGIEFRCRRGDTAVVFNDLIDHEVINNPEMVDIAGFWRLTRDYDYITIPHFHNGGQLDENEWLECPYPGVETLLEIYSCHGAYDVADSLERKPPQIKSRRSDRDGNWFLQRGYKYGFCCNSDGHKGKSGISGLTAVYAPELTKTAIFDAIRARRVYGVTNARIRLLFTAGDQLMGSELKLAAKTTLRVAVSGEEKFKSVELIRNGELFERFRPMSEDFEVERKVDTSTPAYWYVRAVQVDNEIAWSSPIWFAE